MRFTVITHVEHKKQGELYFGYGPYVREMNIWEQYAPEVEIVAPLSDEKPEVIDLAYAHRQIVFTKIPSFNMIGSAQKLKAFVEIPRIAWKIFVAMRRSDHIHLRCPGNIGLIGCAVQILFPFKPKTAKYAGNWDPASKQPLSYRLQKWLLSNTFLTRNMQVLVYGEWPKSTKNILPFFTATYKASEAEDISPRPLSGPIRFLFVGSLVPGKQPMLALRMVESLREKGIEATLEFFGEGSQRPVLEAFIAKHRLSDWAILKGNQNQDSVRQAYKQSHFLFLPSRSEGWPKVVAEAMFWGAVPICTPVSCVPQMLGNGGRGILLSAAIEKDVRTIQDLISDPVAYVKMAQEAMAWSRQFTLDKFDSEIKKLMQQSDLPMPQPI